MPEPPDHEPELEDILGESEEPGPIEQMIAGFEAHISALENKVYEERFIWILVAVVLVDIYVFSNMNNWSGPIVIGILELIGIVILADRCQVDTVAPLIDRLTGFVHNSTRRDQ